MDNDREPEEKALPAQDGSYFRNRRAFPRTVARGVVVCILDKFGMGKGIQGKLLNLSSAGAAFRFPSQLEIDQSVMVELQPIGAGKSIQLPATVRFSSADAEEFITRVRFEKRVKGEMLRHFFR